jgi:4-aminobutyrate aminotransferase
VPDQRAGGRDEALVVRDRTALSEAAKIRFFPFVPVRANGTSVWTADGRELLDFSAGWAVANTGHGDPAIATAVAEVLRAGNYGGGMVSAVVEPTIELAERLLALVPTVRPAKVWFGHSGSDASEAAARLAIRATGRRRIVSFIGSYHGSTGGSAALSGHTAQASYADVGSIKIPYPDAYRPLFADDPRANEVAILRYLEDGILTAISPAADTAAIFVEAIQSDGGDLAPGPEFFAGLARICRQHSILLILDEVKVGLGRSGDWFAYQEAGVVPDIVVIGKALGGGLPISAVVGRADVLDAGAGLAVFTLAGNPVTAAAGLAVLRRIEDDALAGRAKEAGDVLEAGLRVLADRHPLIGDVRGRGLIRGAELVADPESRVPAALETSKVVVRAAELGLVVFYCGLRSNVLEITPPLTITAAEIGRGLEILDSALTAVEAGLVSNDALVGYAGW